MIFQLTKAKTTVEKPLQDETLSRWRQAAAHEPAHDPGRAEVGGETFDLGETATTPVERPFIEKISRAEQIEKIVLPATKQSAPEGSYLSKALPRDPGLSVDDDLARRFGARVKSALGPGATIQGKLTFESPVRIDGSLVGEVTSTSTLIVGEQGSVQAEIKVGSLVVLGQVNGNVVAQDLVEIRKGGHLEANIQAARLVVEEGGFFSGRSSMFKK